MSDTGTGKTVRTSRRRPSTRVIVGAVLVVLAFIFIIENREPATIRVIIPLVVMPLWAALASMFVVGFAVGALWFRRR
ncbi:MAG TPA: DUF1049 domain-containing protein [Pseudonocardia sp.]|jgi:uncharacterized integral membrane protein